MAIQGPRTTGNQAAATVRQTMDDVILLLNKFDVPLQTSLQREGVDNTKYEWLEDDLDTQTVTATGVEATDIIPVVDSSNIRVRDLLKVVPAAGLVENPTGIWEVTAVPSATQVTTNATMWASTTPDTLSNGVVLEIIGQVPYEGADPQASRDGDPSGKFNYTAIFQELVDASRSARKQRQWGITDPLARAKARKVKELAIRLERALVHSVRNLVGGASTKQRTFAGFLAQVTTNVATAATAGTNFAVGEVALADALQSAYNLGGSPSRLMVSPLFKRKFSSLNTDKVRVDRDDPGAGQVRSVYESDFGELNLEVNRHFPRNRALAIQDEYVWLEVFDDWFSEPLAKTGDTEKEQMVGEFGLKVKNEKAHAVVVITDIDT
jgi:hypothetical protein